MKIPLVIASVVILAVVGWLLISKTGQHQNMYSSNITTTQTDPSAKFDKAPDFHLQDYNSKTVSLADFAGKSVVINSWAVWCPFCREELEDFATVQREFGDRVAIIAIDRAEPLETAKRFTDELGLSDKLVFLLDPDDSFYWSIGGFSMPETIFVDTDGNIRIHKRGPMKADEIRDKVQSIL